MNDSLRADRGSLTSLLLAATGAWLVFIAGVYADLTRTAGRPTEALYGPNAEQFVAPSIYFTVVAVALLAVGALLAKRRVVARDRIGLHPFSRSVLTFSNITLIVALVLAALAGVAAFMNGFYATSDANDLMVRTLSVYVPIVLYTGLLVSVLLFGFVFTQRPNTALAPVDHTPRDPEQSKRALALSYVLPIIAVAIALILGLIVYDITKTAPEAWIWVIILAIIAVGIMAGTTLARRGTPPAAQPSGVSTGAKNLNIVLSIVFVAVVTMMSLSYATSAVSNLGSSPWLTINAYEDDWGTMTDPENGIAADALTLQIDGSDLRRHTDVSVTLHPGGATVLTAEVDRTGYFYVDDEFPTDVEVGTYTLSIEAESEADELVRADLAFSIDADGLVRFPDGAHASQSSEGTTLIPVTAAWIFGDLVPAFLMWLLACIVVFVTLSLRNRADV